MARAPVSLRLIVALASFVLIAPIAIIVAVSFGGSGYLEFPPSSFSLRWYEAFFGDARWWSALGSSALIALITSFVATSLGFFGAYAIVRSTWRFRSLLLGFALMPMIVPQMVTAIAMFYVASQAGLVGNTLWIAICHSVIALPIVLLILLSTLQAIDVSLERAAEGMGCSRAGVFRHVVVPLALPGIVSASLFSFLVSFDELIVSLFLTGITTQTLPVRIWNSLRLEVEPTIAAVSTFLVALTVLVLAGDWIVRRIAGRNEAA